MLTEALLGILSLACFWALGSNGQVQKCEAAVMLEPSVTTWAQIRSGSAVDQHLLKSIFNDHSMAMEHRLVPNRKRRTSRLYIVTLLI